MRAFILALFAGLIFSAAIPGRADNVLPSDYKRRIEAFLKAERPQVYHFICDYYAPKPVLVGDARKEEWAVRCDWGVQTRSGDVAAMVCIDLFIFDGDKISRPRAGEKLEWPEGDPMPREKKID